jgi:iron complex outermembrane receptor protein
MLSASYIDAEVQNVAVAPNVLRDVEPSFTPEFQWSGLVRYQWPTEFMGGNVAFQMDANYATSAYHNIRNFQAHKMDDYVIGNARLSWLSIDGIWEAQAFVNNLADAHNQITGFELATLCGCSEEAYGKPRWFGVRVHYNWN